MGLEFSTFIGTALILGVIVSLDVSGLIISQFRGFSYKTKTGYRRSIIEDARIHTLWHALLFLFYMLAIWALTSFVEFFSVKIPDILQLIWENFVKWLNLNIEIDLGILAQQVVYNFTIILGMLVIVFVWLTYSEKINEDHSEKMQFKDSEGKLRADVRILYRIVRSRPRIKRISSHALAATVAIDMLAVSALSKSLFFSSAETNNTEAVERLLALTDYVWLDIIIFSIFLGVFVMTISILAGIFSREIGTSIRKAIEREDQDSIDIQLSLPDKPATFKIPFIPRVVIYGLRFAEPLFVFVFVAYAVDMIFSPSNSQHSFDALQVFSETSIFMDPRYWSFSFFMTGTLIIRHGLSEVLDNIRKGIGVSMENEILTVQETTSQVLNQLFKAFLRKCISFFVPLALITILFVLSHSELLMNISLFKHTGPFGVFTGLIATITATLSIYFHTMGNTPIFSGVHK